MACVIGFDLSSSSVKGQLLSFLMSRQREDEVVVIMSFKSPGRGLRLRADASSLSARTSLWLSKEQDVCIWERSEKWRPTLLFFPVVVA